MNYRRLFDLINLSNSDINGHSVATGQATSESTDYRTKSTLGTSRVRRPSPRTSNSPWKIVAFSHGKTI